VQYGARLEDSLPLHYLAECGPYESSEELEDDPPEEPSSPASSATLDHKDLASEPLFAP
jgi:hypothetical protein